MQFGLAIMNDFPPGTVAAERVTLLREQVRAAREAGIGSIWVLQRYLGNMPTVQPGPLLAALAADARSMCLRPNKLILPLLHPGGVAEAWSVPPRVWPDRLKVVLGDYLAEGERLGRGGPADLVVRRELVLDDDPERAREVGLAARGALTRKYAEFNSPDATASYRHLRGEASAAEVADESYLFTDPDTCIAALQQLPHQVITPVI